MSPLISILSLTTLFLASTTAQELYPPQPTCTSTITHPPGCCPKIAAHTATSYTDCNSCALAIVTEGPMCMMYCGTTTPVDPSRTTTVTQCGPSTIPSMTTSRTKSKACTRTVTDRNPFPCGDCGVGLVDVTTTVDCKGCALSTTTSAGEVGICVCPTRPATRTVSFCAPSVRAEATGY